MAAFGSAPAGLHHLPSLACDTAGPITADGRRGWWLLAPAAGDGGNGSGDDGGSGGVQLRRRLIPAGTGSCASPVEQVGVFGGAAAPDADGGTGGGGGGGAATPRPSPDGGRRVEGGGAGAPTEGGGAPGGDDPEGALVPTTPVRRTAFAARLATFLDHPISGRFLTDLRWVPLPRDDGGGAAGGGGPGGRRGAAAGPLVHGPTAARLLTYTYNTLAGAVARTSGAFDVLGVSRVTVGVCLRNDCADASAVALAAAQGRDMAGQLPLLTVAGDTAAPPPRPDLGGGIPTPPPPPSHHQTVSMVDDDVLSLGRAVLADPAWLGVVPIPAPTDDAAETPAASPASPAASGDGGGGGGSGSPWKLMAQVALNVGADDNGLCGGNSEGCGALDSRDPGGPPPPPPQRGPTGTYALGMAATDASRAWLPSIAAVLCHPPAASFVRSRRETLCGGAPLPRARGGADDAAAAAAEAPIRGPPTGPPPRAEGVEVAPLTGAAASARANARRSEWLIAPRSPGVDEIPLLAVCPPLDVELVTEPARSVGRPAWVAARGGREVNPRSPAERALAAATVPCTWNVSAVLPHEAELPETVLVAVSSSVRRTHLAAVEEDLRRLSVSYDSRAFAEAPPPDPATVGSIVLALIVLVPEAIALLTVYLSAPVVTRREAGVVALVFAAGLVSTGGIVSLAATEVAGAAWRASSVRDGVRLDLGRNASRWGADRYDAFVERGNSLAGVAVYHTQTLVVVARTGYHPARMVGLAAASVGVYLALSGVMGALVVRSIRRRHWRRRLLPPPLDAATAAAGDAPPEKGEGWEWEWGGDSTAVAAPAGKPQSAAAAALGRLWRRRPDGPPRAPGGEASEGWLPGDDEPPAGALK
ncbi:hypothetical protein I4F81_012617 [Pyropia yezoensis]|uniref:Uncharacterized protein n=1 Tax=Pyropia yezoensis TaxID=2788 RepID=A0ACC3CJK6_PYRYE|nr:hypothetical protein I4F81_012617 [Neopyropia yezoensis]